ncbi:MAG TPA: hypothetical protein DD381_05435 [Lentisphaeria bacterium]|nr:hypothetical protein [Lentisphaeria bacterium]
MKKVFEEIDKIKNEIISDVENLNTYPLTDETNKHLTPTGNIVTDAWIERIKHSGRVPIYNIVEIPKRSDADEMGDRYVQGALYSEFVNPNIARQMEKSINHDLSEEERRDADQKWLSLAQEKAQTKLVDKACDILKELSKARARLEHGNFESGIVQLIITMRMLPEFKTLLAQTQIYAGEQGTGKLRIGKTKLSERKKKELFKFMKSLIAKGCPYTRTDDKKLEKSAVAQSVKKFRISRRTVQELYPLKSFK